MQIYYITVWVFDFLWWSDGCGSERKQMILTDRARHKKSLCFKGGFSDSAGTRTQDDPPD